MFLFLLTFLSLNLIPHTLGAYTTKTNRVCSTYYGGKSLQTVPSRTKSSKSTITIKITKTSTPLVTITPSPYIKTIAKYVTVTMTGMAPRKTDVGTKTTVVRDVVVVTMRSLVRESLTIVREVTAPPGTRTFGTEVGFLPIQSDEANYASPSLGSSGQEMGTTTTGTMTKDTTQQGTTDWGTTGQETTDQWTTDQWTTDQWTTDPWTTEQEIATTEFITEDPDPTTVYYETEYTDTGYADATTTDDGEYFETDGPMLVVRNDFGAEATGKVNARPSSTMSRVCRKSSSTMGRVNIKPSRTPAKVALTPSRTPGKSPIKPSTSPPKRFPASVLCENAIRAYTTKTQTATARRRITQTARRRTISKTLTFTLTARATKPTTHISITVTKSVTYKSTRMDIVLSTSTSTTTTIRTVAASSTISAFPACSSNNYLAMYNGNKIINGFPNPQPDNAVSYIQVTGSNTTYPLGCCISCQLQDRCVGFGSGYGGSGQAGRCVLLIADTCAPKDTLASFYAPDDQSTDYGFVVGNGNCGRFRWSADSGYS